MLAAPAAAVAHALQRRLGLGLGDGAIAIGICALEHAPCPRPSGPIVAISSADSWPSSLASSRSIIRCDRSAMRACICAICIADSSSADRLPLPSGIGGGKAGRRGRPAISASVSLPSLSVSICVELLQQHRATRSRHRAPPHRPSRRSQAGRGDRGQPAGQARVEDLSWSSSSPVLRIGQAHPPLMPVKRGQPRGFRRAVATSRHRPRSLATIGHSAIRPFSLRQTANGCLRDRSGACTVRRTQAHAPHGPVPDMPSMTDMPNPAAPARQRSPAEPGAAARLAAALPELRRRAR